VRVLCLDASSTTIGIAVIDYDDGYKPTLIHQEFYKPNKSLELTDMLVETRRFIIGLAETHKTDEIVIEDYVRFMSGKSNSKTTILLAILNMTLRIAALDNLGINVVPYNVLKIRHALKKTKTIPSKEEMPELVAEILGIKFPYLYKENRKKEVLPIPECNDVADAIAVGLTHIKVMSEPKKKAKTKKKVSKKKTAKKAVKKAIKK